MRLILQDDLSPNRWHVMSNKKGLPKKLLRQPLLKSPKTYSNNYFFFQSSSMLSSVRPLVSGTHFHMKIAERMPMMP